MLRSLVNSCKNRYSVSHVLFGGTSLRFSTAVLLHSDANHIDVSSSSVQEPSIVEQPTLIRKAVMIPKAVCGFFIGKRGTMITSLEAASKCSVRSEGQRHDENNLEYTSFKAVATAEENIEKVEKYVHFLVKYRKYLANLEAYSRHEGEISEEISISELRIGALATYYNHIPLKTVIENISQCRISIARHDRTSSTCQVRFFGEPKNVQNAVEIAEFRLKSLELNDKGIDVPGDGEIAVKMDIPRENIGWLLASGGSPRRAIELLNQCRINVMAENDTKKTILLGKEENIKKTQEHILDFLFVKKRTYEENELLKQ